jgi:hypothetical protein
MRLETFQRFGPQKQTSNKHHDAGKDEPGVARQGVKSDFAYLPLGIFE